jgi:peptidoglycan/LPS O-acetylase OafA/YrhL
MTLVAAFLALCCLAAYFTTHGSGLESFFSYLISDMRFMTFMFLGCLFYYVLYDELTARAALAYGTVIYTLFLTVSAFYEATVFGPLAKNYTYALALFLVCYLLRKRFRDNKIIDFVADISFPLYLVHSTIGYVTMPILIDKGIPYTLAWMLCLGLALFVAFIVHRYVEVPVNALGKRITNFRSPWSAKPTPGANLAG